MDNYLNSSPDLLSGAPIYRMLSGTFPPGVLSGNSLWSPARNLNYSSRYGLSGTPPTGQVPAQYSVLDSNASNLAPSLPPATNGRARLHDLQLAGRKRVNEAECELQLERDLFQCKMVGLPGCFAQAMERYGNCLAGRQIPPFNY
jgi:hypothetical protein